MECVCTVAYVTKPYFSPQFAQGLTSAVRLEKEKNAQKCEIGKQVQLTVTLLVQVEGPVHKN